ncbi:MAG TPA: DUF2905 domain-containing protein [Candidatus Dormibacteraeota bacterium]|nr:DUF2905 domain-containing protein [Candidatus Dormibacteraeota bacterium]
MNAVNPGPRLLITLGAALLILGALWALLPQLRLGRLPGDLAFGGERWRVYVPLGTSLLLSLVLTLVLGVLSWLFGARR